jgi:AcrR family transcriptional regulator
MPRARNDDRALSEERIVAAALDLIKRGGAASLTMRALAKELGVSPMAAYYYVDDKEDLLRLVGNSVLAKVEVADSSQVAWDDRLRSVLRDQRKALKRHPGLREALTGLDLEQRQRIEDAEFDLLVEAGFEPAEAVAAFRAVIDWMLGNAFSETILRDPKRRRPPNRTKAGRAAKGRHSSRSASSDAYFEFGLQALIAGLHVALDATRRS